MRILGHPASEASTRRRVHTGKSVEKKHRPSPSRVADAVEELERVHHAVLGLVLEHHLVEFAQGGHEDDLRPRLETLDEKKEEEEKKTRRPLAALTLSKQWIHFLRSLFCPPTSMMMNSTCVEKKRSIKGPRFLQPRTFRRSPSVATSPDARLPESCTAHARSYTREPLETRLTERKTNANPQRLSRRPRDALDFADASSTGSIRARRFCTSSSAVTRSFPAPDSVTIDSSHVLARVLRHIIPEHSRSYTRALLNSSRPLVKTEFSTVVTPASRTFSIS